jgi:SAM-dependent methyltransferase
MPRFDAAQIRGYYDRHTAAFVATGQGGSALHRAVWGPGVTTRAGAFRYVEDEIATLLRELPPAFGASHVVDLGCGVGGSLCHLAQHLPIRGTGITLSPVQARLATARIRQSGHQDRLRCLVGDYCAVPDDVGPADLAFAIESFVHGPDPAAFLAQCRSLIRPGGLLVICDDARRAAAGPEATRTIERFTAGWRVNTLLSAEELASLARTAGFSAVRTVDLSPFVDIRRPRDRVVDAMVALTGWLPLENTRFGYLVGGSALQRALAHGWIGYDFAVFRRDR